MTNIFLIRTFIANPGYLPKWLKTPLNSQREPPVNLVRVYNMRFWMANKIHSFEEFVQPIEEENIEISLNSTAETSEQLIIEEESASQRLHS